LGFVQLGSALDKLTLQIGYQLRGIGERAVGRRAQDLVETDLPRRSYPDRHWPPQVAD